jgi:hypothetical protein
MATEGAEKVARAGETDGEGGARRRRRGRGRRTATEGAEKAVRPGEATVLEGKEMPMALEATEAEREKDRRRRRRRRWTPTEAGMEENGID